MGISQTELGRICSCGHTKLA